jgi:hypothetical protein
LYDIANQNWKKPASLWHAMLGSLCLLANHADMRNSSSNESRVIVANTGCVLLPKPGTASVKSPSLASRLKDHVPLTTHAQSCHMR